MSASASAFLGGGDSATEGGGGIAAASASSVVRIKLGWFLLSTAHGTNLQL
jgi:hypothetical protein